MSWLRHPLLDAAGAVHGFGTRGCDAPTGLVRPRQVHGRRVLHVTRRSAGVLGEADALVCDVPGIRIGIVTADCLPVLLATPSGAVAAAHAGWRGLAAGVLAETLEALDRVTRDATEATAVIGPHVRAGCYEVDGPVVRELGARFGSATDAALAPTRSGHWRIDLAQLATLDLVRAGLRRDRVAVLHDACTACDPVRFHSYRRDGPNAGRLFHFVMGAPGTSATALDTRSAPA